jgi:HlyD family secretion protein
MPFIRLLARLGFAAAMAGLAAEAALAQEKTTDSAQETSSSVAVVHAKQGCFFATARVTGFLFPAQQAIVTLELEGYRVVDILAREGDRVRAGVPIARLERVGTPMPGQPEMPATIQLLAPAAGRIEKSTAQLGAVLSPKSEPLFRIAGDEIEMEADVPSLYLSQIAPKQTVRVETPNGEVIGQVKRISTQVDQASQMGHVRALLAPDPALRIGSFVRATIEAGQSCGVSVPRSAVFYGTDGTTVQIVRAQIVETHRVRIGLVSDQDAEIKEGVREGDYVVAHAGSSLRDGDQVTPKFAEDSDRTERH